MMLRLLSTAADLLPQVAAKELLRLPPLPGRNTAAAMNAGVCSAVVGGVQHLVSRYREQYGEETLVVISGGDGPLLRPHLTEPVQVIDHLVLRGLAMLASANKYKISPSAGLTNSVRSESGTRVLSRNLNHNLFGFRQSPDARGLACHSHLSKICRSGQPY